MPVDPYIESLLGQLPEIPQDIDYAASRPAIHKESDALHDEVAEPAGVTRALMCSGKIYYELAEERAKRGASHSGETSSRWRSSRRRAASRFMSAPK